MTARTLSELAALCNAELEGDGDALVVGPAPLGVAGADEISFLGNKRNIEQLERTSAGAVLVAPDVDCSRDDVALLRCDDPARTFDRVVRAFAPDRPARSGIDPTAVIDPQALVGEGVYVGPHCVVEADVSLGAGAQLYSRAFVGEGCRIGERSILHPGVTLHARVEVGADCVLNAGVVVGTEGFGFHLGNSGWERIPQVGTVVIEDEVEVGANSTIDRARFGVTRIRRGAKLDNLVHVAHNVEVGESALLVAQVGIAGSTTVGPFAVLAGQVGVSDHVHIGARARVGGGSAVFSNVGEGEEVFGIPAGPKRAVLRGAKRVHEIDQLRRDVKELRRRLSGLEALSAEGGE